MDAPDALTEAVARAKAAVSDFVRLAEIYQEEQRLRAKRAMSVPGIADALARDAQVREIVAAHDGLVLDRAIGFGRLVALYPSPGDRDDSEEQR